MFCVLQTELSCLLDERFPHYNLLSGSLCVSVVLGGDGGILPAGPRPPAAVHHGQVRMAFTPLSYNTMYNRWLKATITIPVEMKLK